MLMRLNTALYRRRFHAFGRGSCIHPGLNVNNPASIAIGSGVVIGTFCWIGVIEPATGAAPQLVIDDGCSIGSHAMIHARRGVHLGRRVLLAPSVFISDTIHEYRDADEPVINQPVSEGAPVVVGEGSFLGIGSCVLPGVTIGEHAVIGANAVVACDIPPYSVAVGNPARVVRSYNHETGLWQRHTQVMTQ